jgi:hypothetical protein
MNTNFDQSSKIKWKEVPRWVQITWIIAIVNFLSFMAGDFYLSGSAPAGKKENGKYYLGEHGHYTEVSEKVFEYSEIHASSMWVTHAAAIISAGIFFVRRKTPPTL